jgi:uroporphyrinogen III methyltransferase/synthase
MARILEELGATVLYFPTIEVAEPESPEELDNAIAQLKTYDWVVFTSSNAVEYFFRRLATERGDGADALSAARICAVGPATSRALAAAGAKTDLVAADSRAEGILAALVEFLGSPDRLSGLSFLLPRGNLARDFLPVELAKHGARVSAPETYRTMRPAAESDSLARDLVEGRIDAVTFASPSAVSNFAAMVGASDLSELLSGIVVASIGPATTDAIRAHGIKDPVQSDIHNATALAVALARVLAQES